MITREISPTLAAHKLDESSPKVQTKGHFNALLQELQQQDMVTLRKKATHQAAFFESSTSQQYQEDLQARLEIAQQDARRESMRGSSPYTQPVRVVVGMMSQDFWRQAFSNAIVEHERASEMASFQEPSTQDSTPALTSLFNHHEK